MFTMPQDNAGMGTHNPLAMQFLTQGQMGYMPQAQYLTSSDYGAYRTLPTPTDFMSQSHQSMSLWQSYLQSRRGNIGGVTGNYFFNTYDPMQSQTNRTIMARRQYSDKMDSLESSAFGAAMSYGLPAVMGAALGPVGLLGGAAISMSIPGVGDHMVQRRRQARQIQNISMPGITSGPDMSQALGQGFSLEASGRLVSDIRKEAVDDFSFRQEDYTKFLQAGISSGLTDFSGTASQYSQDLKQMRENVKMMAEFLENKDVQGLFKDMKRIQTMGGSLKTATSTAITESMFARSAGLGHEEMVSTYGAQGALQYTQRGMTGIHGSLQAMGQAASITMAMRSGLITPDALSRAGGKSGLTQSITEGTATALNKIKTSMLPGLTNPDGTLDKEMLKKYTEGEISYEQVMEKATANMDNVEKAIQYKQNAEKGMHNLQESLGPMGVDAFMAKTALAKGRVINPDGDRRSQLYAGYTMLGLGQEAANAKAEQYSSPEYVEGMRKQAEIQNRKANDAVREELENKYKLVNQVKGMWRRLTQSISSNVYGSWEEDRARKADQEENEDLGIFTTSTRGMTGVQGGFTEDFVDSASIYADDITDTAGAELSPGKTMKDTIKKVSDLKKDLKDTTRLREQFDKEKPYETRTKEELAEDLSWSYLQYHGNRFIHPNDRKRKVKDSLTPEMMSKIDDYMQMDQEIFDDEYEAAPINKDAINKQLQEEMDAGELEFGTENYYARQQKLHKNAMALTYSRKLREDRAQEQKVREQEVTLTKELAHSEQELSQVLENAPVSLKELDKVYTAQEDAAFKKQFLRDKDQTLEEREAARDKLGMTGFQISRMMHGLKAKDITMESIVERVAEQKEISMDEAAELVNAEGVLDVLSTAAMEGESGEKLRLRTEKQMHKSEAVSSEFYRDVSDKAYEEAQTSVENLVGNDRDSRDALLSIAKDTGTKDGKNVAFEAFGIAEMVHKLGDEKWGWGNITGNKDRIHKRLKGLDASDEQIEAALYGDDKARQQVMVELGIDPKDKSWGWDSIHGSKDKLAMRLEDLGATPEQIDAVVQSGDTKALQQIFVDQGMDADDAESAIKLGTERATANPGESIIEVENKLDAVHASSAKAPIVGAMASMQERITDIIGATGQSARGFNLESFLESKEDVMKLRDTLGDAPESAEDRQFLSRLIKHQEDSAKTGEGVNYAEVVASTLHTGEEKGTVESDVTDGKLTSAASKEQKEEAEDRAMQTKIMKDAIPIMDKWNKAATLLIDGLTTAKGDSPRYYNVLTGVRR